jgi:hypothetical protein
MVDKMGVPRNSADKMLAVLARQPLQSESDHLRQGALADWQ